MRPKISVISSGYNIVWAIYTVYYIALFAVVSGEAFSIVSAVNSIADVIPLNIVMNTISLVLAAVGILVSHHAARSDYSYWSGLNRLIHVGMLVWVLGGSLWVLLLLI